MSGKMPLTMKKKNLSVFDEYEQRGGVLEGYEDLNSDKSSEDDHVLSQMVADQHSGRSHSHNTSQNF